MVVIGGLFWSSVWFESTPRDEIRLVEPRFQQLRGINTTHGIKIVIQESSTKRKIPMQISYL